MIKRLVEVTTMTDNEAGLHEALIRARSDAKRLEAESSALCVAGAVGLVLVASRGIVAIAMPQAAVSSWLPLGLCGALFLAVVLQVFGARRRVRRERLLGHIQFMQMARDLVEQSRTHVLDGDPYRSDAVRASMLLLCERHQPQERRAVRASGVLVQGHALVRRLTAAVGAAAAVGLLLTWTEGSPEPRPAVRRWTFVETSAMLSELGLKTHVPESGAWTLEHDANATGARALVNREGEPGARPAIVTAVGLSTRDLRATTRCKASSAKVTKACGLVFRFQDADNHLLARVDFTSGELALVAVSAGKERVLRTAPVLASSDVWQEIGIITQGDRIRVSWNGTTAIDLADASPAKAGSVGIWAPAAAEASFDDLTVDG